MLDMQYFTSNERRKLPSVTAAFALMNHLPAVTVVVVSVVPVVPIHDPSRTIVPGAGYPDPAGGEIRPISCHPDIIHARTGRDRLHDSHRRRSDGCCVNHRRRDDDRQREPDGDAVADSGVGRQGGRTDQRDQEKHFSFHSMFSFSGVIALTNPDEQVTI